MREILFRGKRKDNDEWEEGDLIQLHDGRMFIVDNKFGACIDENGNFINTESPFVCEVIPETVGQYTGLVDKNGKKIFEGDVVKHYHDRQFPKSYSKGVIYFDEEYLHWKRTSENVNVCVAPDCIYEVIGNIHDNPELHGTDDSG